MATLRNLDVAVRAKTQDFRRGMKQAKTATERFGKAVKVVGLGTAAFGAILAGVAAGALVQWVRSASAAIDRSTKFADRIGVSTEALVGLEHAAAQTGVKVTQLHLGLQRMTRRVSEAAQGTGEARAAIAELGLDAQQLARLSPDEQFVRLSEAMEQVEFQGDRVRLAMKLFDSEGVALVNTMRGGEGAIRGFLREAEKLGLTFSREQAAQVEEMNDALDNLNKAFEGLKRAATIELAPFIEAAASALTDLATAGEGLGPKITDGVEMAVIGVSELVGRFERLDNIIRTVAKVGAGLGVGDLVFPEEFDEMFGETVSFDEMEKRATNRAAEIANLFQKLRIDAARRAHERRGAVPVEIGTVPDNFIPQEFDQLPFSPGGGLGPVHTEFQKIENNLRRVGSAASSASSSVLGVFDAILTRGADASEILRSLALDFARIGLRSTLQGPLEGLFGGIFGSEP